MLTWTHTDSGGPAFGALPGQALGDLQAVDGVGPVEVLGDQAGLVALDRADAVPLQRQVGQQRHLLHRLLDVVLPERRLPHGVRLAHRLGAEGLGHRQQRDFVHRALRPRTARRDALADGLEVAANRRHNQPGL
jgi:hypothetical protein